MNTKLSFLGAAVLLLTSACSEDSVELVNNGSEITFNTSISRAQNLDASNLESFKVWAFSDITDSAPFINGQTATKVNGKGYFAFSHSIFWPSDVNALNFWAVAPATIDGIGQDGSGKKLRIDNYSPDTDPTKQLDLIVAKTTAELSKGTSVSLEFRHALSQIIINASEGTEGDETKDIKIKGVWVVNPSGEENLSTTDGNDLIWSTKSSTKAQYGIEYSIPRKLDHTSNALLDAENKTNLLLIPQQLKAWEGKTNPTNASKGAYILFLCRVEAIHPGAEHVGGSDGAIKSDTENNRHIHQLFPYTTKFNEYEYGYTCVPIDTKWEAGKRYIYNLSFCGATSGAGIYPPTGSLDEKPDGNGEYKYIKIPAEGKYAGDPVLDNPISFTVTVKDWVDAGGSTGGWTEGNIDMN